MSTILPRAVRDLMSQSFLDYSMSVITGRALPDVRDGLKPVHRRILWAMFEAGNTHSRAYKKSARMVGDVIGKYHPHGDVSVYDAAVRMAQSFSMSQPLIEGQGNFGSVDGDNPAAMRYTEMRLSRLAGEFFDDIRKDTVDWRDNYDGSEREPVVLPAPFPNLLVNGVDGIAVGMASSIPPHNLRSVVEATLLLMERPDAATGEVAAALQAPDFPTGAIVHALDGFAEAIETGRGRVKLRARWHEEDRARGAKAVVIDEIPFQVNKAALVQRIAQLVRDREVEDIADMRDESSKEGIRIWIGLKKDASPEAVFSDLASKTDLEISVNYNCVVLSGGRPRQLGLRQMILEWIAFRERVVHARHVWERTQAQARLHILAGFMAALSRLDDVIAAIRAALNPAQARLQLCALLQIDETQAQAILDLKLHKLTGMELDGIRAEHAEVSARVAELTRIIEDRELVRGIVRQELAAVAARFGGERRTEIGHGITDITHEDLVPREDVLITMTRAGYVKRVPLSALERQNRGTRGRRAVEVADDDALSFMKQVHSHDSLMVFARSGQVHGIKAWRIPECSLTQKGRHIRNVIDGLDEEIHAVLALPERDPEQTVLTVSRQGQVKRTSVEEYEGAIRRGGVRGLGLEEGDGLACAFVVRDEDHVILVSSSGSAIRFEASDVRVMGRTACGVRGIRLEVGEFVVGAAVVEAGADQAMDLMCAGARGVGKRTPVGDFPLQGRGGSGVIAFRINSKTGPLVAAMGVRQGQDLVALASNGVSNRISVSDIRQTGRAASGVILLDLDEGATLISVTACPTGATLSEDPESSTVADPAEGAVA
jgi:DNA gyrase subunit A